MRAEGLLSWLIFMNFMYIINIILAVFEVIPYRRDVRIVGILEVVFFMIVLIKILIYTAKINEHFRVHMGTYLDYIGYKLI